MHQFQGSDPCPLSDIVDARDKRSCSAILIVLDVEHMLHDDYRSSRRGSDDVDIDEHVGT